LEENIHTKEALQKEKLDHDATEKNQKKIHVERATTILRE
jgi:hypothetical protein